MMAKGSVVLITDRWRFRTAKISSMRATRGKGTARRHMKRRGCATRNLPEFLSRISHGG